MVENGCQQPFPISNCSVRDTTTCIIHILHTRGTDLHSVQRASYVFDSFEQLARPPSPLERLYPAT